jgi:hypothetical protein
VVNLEVRFAGSPVEIENMIKNGLFHEGDRFLDYGVTGNKLSCLGLDAMMYIALADKSAPHIFIARRVRLARPADPVDGIKLENLLGAAGVALVC